MYNLMGFVILFKLMFMNLQQKDLENFSKNKDEEIWYFDFDSFIKTFGIVFLSQLTSYSTDHNLPLLNSFTFQIKNNFIMMKLLAIIFSIIFAFVISFIFRRKFCIEFNLIISAITFLIMGIDECVKFFCIIE